MNDSSVQYDCIVIGAGFGGLFATARMKTLGLHVTCLERGDAPGGVWNWNRYPGVRVDSSSLYYALTHDRDLYREGTFADEYASGEEMRSYFQWLAPRLGVSKDIVFGANVVAAEYQEASGTWVVTTSDGCQRSTRHVIMAIGSLTAPNVPELPGQEDFSGQIVHSSQWPSGPVPSAHRRVGVVGTGSSGVQIITELSRCAEHLTVFQRTPQYSLPLNNRPLDPREREDVADHYEKMRWQIFASEKGRPLPETRLRLAELTPEQQKQQLMACWNLGGTTMFDVFTDLTSDPESNRIVSEFVRNRIRTTVKDPDTAERLLPEYGIGAKRVVKDSGFYEVFNQPNVALVSLKDNPIQGMTKDGLRTATGEFPLDLLVMATGFDAITGPVFAMDIRGRGGQRLETRWGSGARIETLGGLMTSGFPNLFFIGGAQTPAVHVSVPLLNEFMVNRAEEFITEAGRRQSTVVEPDADICREWARHVDDAGNASIVSTVASWYNGGNMAGKPNSFLTYVGGFINYQQFWESIKPTTLLKPIHSPDRPDPYTEEVEIHAS